MIPKPDYCRSCPIAGSMQGFIPPSGTGRIPLLIVGEGGGRLEEREGKPFIGQAGKLLERALQTAGLDRNDYTIANLLFCRPPNNELKGAPYEFEVLKYCRSYLNATVAEKRPRFILALGDVPLRELSLTAGSISELRGYVLPSIYGVPMSATYHPSHLAREPAKFAQLFGVFMHDLRQAERFARRGVPPKLETQYDLHPKLDTVSIYLQQLLANPELPVAYDVETASIVRETEPDDWHEKRIIQIQFSSGAGEALVLPWPSKAAVEILATPNPKFTWNGRLSDDVALRGQGVEIGGESFDAMLMWSHLQPNFSGGRDAAHDEDKGVPARLLNLQAAVSFYYPQDGVWKGTVAAAGPGLGGYLTALHSLRYYGARDADLTWRVGTKLMATLKAQGFWNGFYRYKHQLGKVLTKMSDRGLPIDRDRQEKLRIHIEAQEQELETELQVMIPVELKPFKSYKGFPKDLREAVKAAGLWVKCCKPVEFPEVAVALGYEIVGSNGDQQLRKPLPFNSGSSKQVLGYIQYCIDEEVIAFDDPGNRRWFMPLHIDTKKPSANKAGMEALIDATDDPTLKQIEKCKKIAKLKDYCGEKWLPEDDGCVHAEFRVGATGTGQTTATNPPIQTYPKHLKKEDEWLKPTMMMIKAIIKAPDGYVMIETDYRGFHARMQAFIAEDAAYYRLANIDTHSFLAAHYVGVDDKDTMLQLDDEALAKRLNEIKTEYDYERNYLCKRISFLNAYGGQAEKAATILRLPRIEVEAILNINRQIFKPAFKDLPKKLERMLRRNPRLVTPFGFPRTFWDGDPNQAIAFWVASPAHCTIQDAMIRLDERGALEKYGACNLMHDALWWCCPETLTDECIAVAREEMERASDVLVNSLGAFTCKMDAKRGLDMSSLR